MQAQAEATPVAASGHAPVVHRIHAVALGRKRDALQHLLAQRPEQPTLIYTRTKHGADKIARVLERSGIKAAAIHGDKSQGARNRALAGFKSGELKALVITDIAARLLDADNLPLVISYDLPHITEDYAQRIARTGSAQVPGLAITLITQEESPQFRAVRDLLQYPLELVPLEGFEAAEPFDPERDPLPKPGAEAEGAETPAVAAVESRRDGQGRGRRDRRGRQGRAEAHPREATSPVAPDAASADDDELPEDAQPSGLKPIHAARPSRHERKPRPGRTARGERQPRGDQQPRGDRQPGFNLPLPPLPDDDDDAPGYGNSLAAPPPSQLVAGGPGRRRGRRDPFATVVVDENRVNIYDERQPDDYRDQWSVLGPDTNRPSWTYAEHQPQSLDAPPPRRPNPPAARRSGPGAGPRGPQSGPRGPQRQGRPRRSDGR
jgi:superfamily II DNA/RNA helicase